VLISVRHRDVTRGIRLFEAGGRLLSVNRDFPG